MKVRGVLSDSSEIKWRFNLSSRESRGKDMAESMRGLHRSHRCAEVTKEMTGSEVTLMGWVQKSRNKGGIVFVDLRDRSGLIQLIFENGSIDEEGFEKAGKLRSELLIAVSVGYGKPVRRGESRHADR